MQPIDFAVWASGVCGAGREKGEGGCGGSPMAGMTASLCWQASARNQPCRSTMAQLHTLGFSLAFTVLSASNPVSAPLPQAHLSVDQVVSEETIHSHDIQHLG